MSIEPTATINPHHASITFPAANMRDILLRLKHAVCTDETRYYLQGIYFDMAAERHCAVATDGKVLARQEIQIIGSVGTMPSVILPWHRDDKTLADLTRHLTARHTAPVIIATADVNSRGERSITISTEGFLRETFAIDGSYPDYARVLTNSTPHRITVDRLVLLDAILSFENAWLKGKEAKQRVIGLSAEGRAVTLAENNDGIFEYGHSIEIPAEVNFCGAYELRFRRHQLAAVLKAMPGKTVTLAFGCKRLDPVIITDPSDDTITHLIMPCV